MPGTEQPSKGDLLNAGGQRTWGQTPYWTASVCPSSSPFPPILCPPNWTTWISAHLRGFKGAANGRRCQEVRGWKETEVWVLTLLVPTDVYLSCFCLSGKCYRCCEVAFSTHFLSLSVSPLLSPIPIWSFRPGMLTASFSCYPLDTTAFYLSSAYSFFLLYILKKKKNLLL